jgi:hypothetical protein
MTAPAAAAPATRITASVGTGGVNTPPDVRLIQDLLNRASGAGLAVDGDCGTLTRDAIVGFQAGFLRQPDGRVDPDGLTFRRLATKAREEHGPPRSDPGTAIGPGDGLRLQALPRRGTGHYSYSSADRQYGTDEMVRLLVDVAATLHRAGLEVGIGDISFEQGGAMPPHKTHQNGRHVDLRPLRTDGGRQPTSIDQPSYSRENTRALVDALLANSSTRRILFNDRAASGVRYYPGHHNHLHVEVS